MVEYAITFMKRGVSMTSSSQYHGILYCVAGALTWGINGVVSQFVFTHYVVNSSWLTAIRMIGAGLLLLLLCLSSQRDRLTGMLGDSVSIRQLLLLSVFGLLLCQYAYLTAIQYSNAGTATVLQTLCVVMMSAYMAIRSRSLPSRREVISVFLAFFGVYLVATNGNPAAMSLSPAGLFWGLMGALGAVTYPVLSHGLACRWGAIAVNAIAMFLGGIILFVSFQLWTLTPLLDLAGWLSVAYIIVGGTVVSFTCFVQGIRLIGPMHATLIGTLEPVTASIIAAVCLGTSFALPEIIGFIAILATVFIIVTQKPSAHKK